MSKVMLLRRLEAVNGPGRIQICQNRGKWIRFLLDCSSRAVSYEIPSCHIKKRPYSYGLFISVFCCAVGSSPFGLTPSWGTFAFRIPRLKRRPFRTYQSRALLRGRFLAARAYALTGNLRVWNTSFQASRFTLAFPVLFQNFCYYS